MESIDHRGALYRPAEIDAQKASGDKTSGLHYAAMKAVPKLFLVLLFLSSALPAEEPRLEQAGELFDSGRTLEALDVLEPLLREQPDHPAALMLRSTLRFVTGETSAGRQDLERSLTLDASQRQGWLNLAGLELAEKDHDAALDALLTAERLDPSAADNDLNLGAVRLLLGDLDHARQRFDRYLRQQRSAEAFYLVAVNYDGSGYRKLALAHLRRAIEMDERLRVEAARDERFDEWTENPEFLALVMTDNHRLALDSHKAARTFGTLPYRADGILLKAVLQTLQISGRPLDPRVQVEADWALMWSDARVKIRQLADGRGRVEMTAPVDRFTPESWAGYTESFFEEVSARILVLGAKEAKRNSGGS